MKKIVALAALAVLIAASVFMFTSRGEIASAETDATAEVLEGWIVPEGYEGRVSVKKTKNGIEIDQLIQGTPSSHAVAIAPAHEGTDSYEVVLSIQSEEYVKSGRLANDVWTGIGFMGKPSFINWRNNEKDGFAKDSPGLFSRFFNLAGEFSFTSDIYCGNFIKDLDNPSDVVDTWTLISDGNAHAQENKDIRIKLAYEEKDGKKFYNLYINGVLVSAAGELASIEPAKVFPDGKIYLEIAMNTQKKDTNANTKVIIKELNGVSYVEGETSGSGEKPNDTTPEKKGCGGFAMGEGLIVVLLIASAVVANKRNRNAL